MKKSIACLMLATALAGCNNAAKQAQERPRLLREQRVIRRPVGD